MALIFTGTVKHKQSVDLVLFGETHWCGRHRIDLVNAFFFILFVVVFIFLVVAFLASHLHSFSGS